MNLPTIKMFLFNELNDIDHFSVSGTRFDTMQCRTTMKKIINHLMVRPVAFLGDISIEIGTSIEKADEFVQHLIKLSMVEILSKDELDKLGLKPYAVVLRLDNRFVRDWYVSGKQLKDFE